MNDYRNIVLLLLSIVVCLCVLRMHRIWKLAALRKNIVQNSVSDLLHLEQTLNSNLSLYNWEPLSDLGVSIKNLHLREGVVDVPWVAATKTRFSECLKFIEFCKTQSAQAWLQACVLALIPACIVLFSDGLS
jgi:hypothetical protein